MPHRQGWSGEPRELARRGWVNSQLPISDLEKVTELRRRGCGRAKSSAELRWPCPGAALQKTSVRVHSDTWDVKPAGVLPALQLGASRRAAPWPWGGFWGAASPHSWQLGAPIASRCQAAREELIAARGHPKVSKNEEIKPRQCLTQDLEALAGNWPRTKLPGGRPGAQGGGERRNLQLRGPGTRWGSSARAGTGAAPAAPTSSLEGCGFPNRCINYSEASGIQRAHLRAAALLQGCALRKTKSSPACSSAPRFPERTRSC